MSSAAEGITLTSQRQIEAARLTIAIKLMEQAQAVTKEKMSTCPNSEPTVCAKELTNKWI